MWGLKRQGERETERGEESVCVCVCATLRKAWPRKKALDIYSVLL